MSNQHAQFYLSAECVASRNNKITIDLFSLRENEFALIEKLIGEVNGKYKLNSAVTFKRELLVSLIVEE